ncbi:hypothetical protein CFP56_006770 [Quercus suber]|uniref:Uncharacterized protein n=1 Tax=Quercus suber TaxID=58331 RepID=A0AAW0L8V0_QUESU
MSTLLSLNHLHAHHRTTSIPSILNILLIINIKCSSTFPCDTHKIIPFIILPNVHDPDYSNLCLSLHHHSNAEPEGEDDASDSSEDIQIALDDAMKVQPSLDISVLKIKNLN